MALSEQQLGWNDLIRSGPYLALVRSRQGNETQKLLAEMMQMLATLMGFLRGLLKKKIPEGVMFELLSSGRRVKTTTPIIELMKPHAISSTVIVKQRKSLDLHLRTSTNKKNC